VAFYQVVPVKDFHMASTLLPGDRVIVDKFRSGLRLPISVIGLPGTDAPYADGIRLPYMRLPAIIKLKRQDVVVFNHPVGSDRPIDRKRLMISRIIGLPTDTVLIRDKVITVNNQPVSPPELARVEYRVVTEGQPIDPAFIRKYRIENPRLVADIGIYDADLPAAAAEELKKMKGISTVRETRHFLGDPSTGYYPLSGFFLWNRDQYGTLRVPAKGMTVGIDVKTIDFYRPIIETHEGHDVMVDFSGVHIDGALTTSYTFEKNYFFMLGDNRDNPNDSRKIGFIPEDHVLGVARRVLWSGQNDFDYIGKFHPGRILKGIR
jgi:signal peptidase I